MYSIVGIVKVAQYLITRSLFDMASNKINAIEPSSIYLRLIKSLAWMSSSDGWFSIVFSPPSIGIIITAGGLLSLGYYKKNRNYAYVYFIFFVWFFTGGTPFFAFSQFFSPRYMYLPHIGMMIVIVLSVYLLLKIVDRREWIISIIMAVIVILFGITKVAQSDKILEQANKNWNMINSNLPKDELTENIQIIVTGRGAGTGGYYIWSTGYLMYNLKRCDVRGIIGKEKNFYNPFDPKDIDYSSSMGGIDIEEPLIVLRYKNNQFKRPFYLLKWLVESGKWVIYKKADNTRYTSAYSGVGKERYINLLNSKGINSADVLWGAL